VKQSTLAPLKNKKRHPICLQRQIQTEQAEFEAGETITPTEKHRREEDLKYSDEYCLKEIIDEQYLWDMRCWNKRSREEAEKWVTSIKENKPVLHNCGHAMFCIKKLLSREVAIKVIVDTMMSNKKIKYKNRLTKCFGGIHCERWTEEKGYSGTNCELCE